ncbi:MAG: lpxA [Burkholderiaceae bacterium]|nr:lpxA [Burkholderiaceae bacterium]
MTVRIHPTAIIDPQAQLADDVKVGAYSVIGANVVIGARTEIGSHSVIEGHTRIGIENNIGHHVLLGGVPQDKKYAGEPTQLLIGDRNTIREFTSVHTGTAQDEGITRIGDDNWIMGYVHIAHDCRIGNKTILASNAQLAGHVHVQDWAIVGGMTGVHQFVKIGAHAMIGGGSALLKDVVPYVMISGNPSAAYGINSEGLKRRGFTPEQIMSIKRAYKMVFRQDLTIEQAIEAIEAAMQSDAPNASAMRLMSDFLRTAERGIVR